MFESKDDMHSAFVIHKIALMIYIMIELSIRIFSKLNEIVIIQLKFSDHTFNRGGNNTNEKRGKECVGHFTKIVRVGQSKTTRILESNKIKTNC